MQQPVVMIVGAGDFIGAAIAKKFAAQGFAVALGRRNADKLQPLLEELRAAKAEARGFALDARDEAQVEQVFATVEREMGPLEVVVFNIGANVSFPIRETTSRVFRKVWEMACFAGFLTGREASAPTGHVRTDRPAPGRSQQMLAKFTNNCWECPASGLDFCE